jgi:hypothetical protein
MKRMLAAALLALAAPATLMAQAADTATATRPVQVWASATLGSAGPGLTTGGLIGAQVALWASRDGAAFALRSAVASDIDFVNAYDYAALAGLRRRAKYATAVVALGPSVIIQDHGSRARSSDIGLAYAAELALSLKYIGAGVSAFGSMGTNSRFFGVGVTLELGKIH